MLKQLRLSSSRTAVGAGVFYESLGFVESELGATFCAASVLVVAFKFLCDCGFVEAEAV